ncbi:hypothetical protein FQN57_003157 [Myotisia sp. PD_48]|nr:hypothetical protein FQN57_003157 [Myotisia sp. PD_48]
MDASNPIVLYDIASRPPVTCYSPNPWKARKERYALNFKQVHYQTEWVELPDVTKVRKSLGAPPARFFPDGSPFYTLPIIKDPATGQIVGDSFDIALYVDKLNPEAPSLFPPSTIGLQAAFNAQVDALFTGYVILCADGLPFNPDTVEISKATFLERAGLQNWEQLVIKGEARTGILEAFKTALGEFSKVYRRTDGLFLEGDTPIFADFIVGGWLQFLKVTLPEWKDIQTWHDGLWGEIHLGLQKYAEVQ